MSKPGWTRRVKEINNFSNQVNTMIEIMQKNKCGIYKRDELDKAIPNLIEVVHFIDSNLFIKRTIGKGIRRLTEFNHTEKAIEIYDYFEQLEKINKSIEDLSIANIVHDVHKRKKKENKD